MLRAKVVVMVNWYIFKMAEGWGWFLMDVLALGKVGLAGGKDVDGSVGVYTWAAQGPPGLEFTRGPSWI